MNVTIRPATVDDARAIAAVHVASWRTTYRGIIDEEALSQLSIRRRADYWRGQLADPYGFGIFVAVDEQGEVIGFATGGEEREDDEAFSAELFAIYLLEETQRNGVGRQLVDAVFADLRNAGHQTILVWVLADNPAVNFYKSLGAIQVRERTIDILGRDYIELGFGWKFS